MNCAVLGSLLLPLKPQRRKRLQEGVKLLDANDAEKRNNKHDLKALEQGQFENGKIDAVKQHNIKVTTFSH